MNKAEEIFQKSGAILSGHFLLASGLHSPIYWEKFRVLQFPDYTEQLCQMIANHFIKQKVEVVAGPTTGGIILAFEVPSKPTSAVAALVEDHPGTLRDVARNWGMHTLGPA